MSLLFFNATATTETYPLALHAALPISSTPADARSSADPSARCGAARPGGRWRPASARGSRRASGSPPARGADGRAAGSRSEEHTSELQSRQYLVCRLLLEKKNKPRLAL